jgi:hypothetical protein
MTGYDDELARVLDSAMDSLLAKLDTALDPEAGLADVYARSARSRPNRSPSPRARHDSVSSDRLRDGCDQIDELTAWLAGLVASGQQNSFAGSSFLELAHDDLVQLRSGLAARTMARPEARQLTTGVLDQLDRADRILRSQDATTLDHLARSLTRRAGSLTGQARAVHEMVIRLYEPSPSAAPVTPAR